MMIEWIMSWWGLSPEIGWIGIELDKANRTRDFTFISIVSDSGYEAANNVNNTKRTLIYVVFAFFALFADIKMTIFC